MILKFTTFVAVTHATSNRCRFRSFSAYVMYSIICHALTDASLLGHCRHCRAAVRHSYTVSNLKLVLTQHSFYARRVYKGELFPLMFTAHLSDNTSGPTYHLPDPHRKFSKLTCRSTPEVVSQVACTVIASCKCSCYPLGGTSVIVFLCVLVGLGVRELPALRSLSHL